VFTGIVEEVGEVASAVRRDGGADIEIRARGVLETLAVGDSIAVSGACLTVTRLTARGFTADVSAETLRRTTLGRLRSGARVNLERPLRLGGRLGGHLVQGHVDGTGRVVRRERQGSRTEYLEVELPRELTRYVAEKGSLAVDGVSLTVGCVRGRLAGFYVIPFTLENTTLRDCRPPADVNLEVDLLARYLEKLSGSSVGGRVAGGGGEEA
jgi:riboflavin synthase